MRSCAFYDYLRLLFARIGKPFCPQCNKPISSQSAQQIIDEIMKMQEGTKLQILSPIVRARTGTYEELFKKLAKSGFARVRINGKISLLDEKIKLDRYKKHYIEVIVDRVVLSIQARQRISEAVELALKESSGLVLILDESSKGAIKERLFSEHNSCTDCGISLPEIEPRLFSFNSPFGACPDCGGLGAKEEVDEDLIIRAPILSIEDGAIKPWSQPITTRTHRWKNSWSGYYQQLLDDVCSKHNIPTKTSWLKLSRKQQEILLFGDNDGFEGVIVNLKRRYTETESEFVREEIRTNYMRTVICNSCHGARLKKSAMSVKIDDKSISELTTMSVDVAREFFVALKLSEKDKFISKTIFKEINQRFSFLSDVGLGYITIDRESSTLSGGEAQRIHLATQIGSGLTGVLYVLDEPSIGLHQKDNRKLLDTMFRLRDMGNTLIVIEHDEETMRSADWIIDLGPGAGIHGGYIVAQGSYEKVLKAKNSLTASYLNGTLRIPIPKKRRKLTDRNLEIIGASQFNLKKLSLNMPLGVFVCVTGVSGSGKSTLVHEIIYKNLAKKLYGSKEAPGKVKEINGMGNIDKVIIVDQSPIGRTPRSNPSTYTGAFTHIRDLFASTQESKSRGYEPGRFSFNVKGGRCENCQGDGTIKIEMQFLPDVYVTCEVCGGKRFNSETLQVHYKGKTIAEVLDMTVEEGYEFFTNIPKIKKILGTLNSVGLNYIKLGQAATTLSGGEAQRVKLANELSKRSTGKTLYMLDEPTTGLHFADVEKLLKVLHELVDHGNTVLVIEHNLEVIKTADWIIDLGPEGGNKGGYVMAKGTPETVSLNKNSFTGKYLKSALQA